MPNNFGSNSTRRSSSPSSRPPRSSGSRGRRPTRWPAATWQPRVARGCRSCASTSASCGCPGRSSSPGSGADQPRSRNPVLACPVDLPDVELRRGRRRTRPEGPPRRVHVPPVHRSATRRRAADRRPPSEIRPRCAACAPDGAPSDHQAGGPRYDLFRSDGRRRRPTGRGTSSGSCRDARTAPMRRSRTVPATDVPLDAWPREPE